MTRDKFILQIDCNDHYMDEDCRRQGGEFDTYEEALTAARKIVEANLKDLHAPGMKKEDLIRRYRAEGEDPWVVPPAGELKFSAWDYASELAEAMTRDEAADLHAALVRDRDLGKFYVYLVNVSQKQFSDVKVLTGAYATDDDRLMETTTAAKELDALRPQSALLLEEGDAEDLDFVIWYQVDLRAGTDCFKYSFQLPKHGGGGDLAEPLPVLAKNGIRIPLKKRAG